MATISKEKGLPFETWSSKGYRIKKGSKAIGRNSNGIPIFSFEQVWKPQEKLRYGPGYIYDNHWEGGDRYDGDWEEYLSFGDTQDMGFFG